MSSLIVITGQQVTGGKSWWKAICDAKKPHTRSLFTCQKCPESVDQPLATSPPPAGPVAPGREWKNEQSRAAHSARSRRLRHLLDDIAASPEMFMSLNNKHQSWIHYKRFWPRLPRQTLLGGACGIIRILISCVVHSFFKLLSCRIWKWVEFCISLRRPPCFLDT